MSGVTLSEAQANLTALQAAYTALIGGVSAYSISTTGVSRSLTRRDLKDLRDEISYWDTHVKKLDRGGITVIGATPVG